MKCIRTSRFNISNVVKCVALTKKGKFRCRLLRKPILMSITRPRCPERCFSTTARIWTCNTDDEDYIIRLEWNRDRAFAKHLPGLWHLAVAHTPPLGWHIILPGKRFGGELWETRLLDFGFPQRVLRGIWLSEHLGRDIFEFCLSVWIGGPQLSRVSRHPQ